MGAGRPVVERLAVAGTALFSSFAVWVSTRHGIGANGTDSVAYLTMADDLAAGRMPYPTVIGVPPTHLPPGWSVVVGALTAILPGVDALAAARILNVLFAGLLPIAVYLAVRGRAARPTWIPALMAGVIATSYPLIELASRAVVEAMFLVLLVVTLGAIGRLSRHRSATGVLAASALVSLLTLTRFVGAAALVPLGVAVLAMARSWRQRLGWLATSAVVTVAPTLAWYLLAPGAVENAHLRGGQRAGLGEAVLSVREAGVTLVRGAFLPAVVHFAIGVALLTAPVLALLAASRAGAPGRPRRERTLAFIASQRLAPWLWFLLGYTALVVVQRWEIDREVISRYWLPYWVVTAVVLGRCLIAWADATRPTSGRMTGLASAVLLSLTAYNVAEVTVMARENAQDGVTLNAVRYQDSRALDALVDAEPTVIYTDHVQLLEFQMYARGGFVPIERMSCRVAAVEALVERVQMALLRGERPAIAIVRRCRQNDFVEALLKDLVGAVVVREPGVGVVVRPTAGA